MEAIPKNVRPDPKYRVKLLTADSTAAAETLATKVAASPGGGDVKFDQNHPFEARLTKNERQTPEGHFQVGKKEKCNNIPAHSDHTLHARNNCRYARPLTQPRRI